VRFNLSAAPRANQRPRRAQRLYEQRPLYVANSTSSQDAGTPIPDSGYTVIVYTTNAITDIVSFDLTGRLSSRPPALSRDLNNRSIWMNLRQPARCYDHLQPNWSEYTDKAKGF
jgi:hypothetical protein